MELITINIYYRKIIDLILEVHDNDFTSAGPGHCMKITGLGSQELEFLWDLMVPKYEHINIYIVSEIVTTDAKYITATRLVELRNVQDAPLLILIPSNSRTAAEDSYGNSTFKEISLDGIESKLIKKLVNQIPERLNGIIKNDILNFLKPNNAAIIDYLLSLSEVGYEENTIGENLHFLSLIPDTILLKQEEKIRSRLNFNRESVALLSAFNKPLYDRISELNLENDSIQKEIVDFLKIEKAAKNEKEICEIIAVKYPNLNFSKWPIPDLDFTHIKLFSEDLISNDLKTVDGTKVLLAENGKITKLKIRFSTNPSPNEIKDLKFFRIILMAVNGTNGEEIMVLRKIKNSNSNRPYRDATIELNSNIIEEGSYFIKVLAEDEYGNVLNANDEFKDSKVQRAWLEAEEEAHQKGLECSKSSFQYKLTCDSEDFDYLIEEAVEREDTQRKDKLNYVLQAYFKFRIESIKNDSDKLIPEPTESSNLWINDSKEKHSSTFHINYSDKHNYQINISTKLRQIENKFIEYGNEFGHVYAQLKSNKLAIGFESLEFVSSELNSLIPNSLAKLRKEVFESIANSNVEGNGILETADIFNYSDQIKRYIAEYTKWTSKLKKQIETDKITDEEKTKLKQFLVELQIIDVARIKTKLPDGSKVEALLLSPLHPLRLSWVMQLIEVFDDWENKTREFSGHKDAWSKNLEELFIGQLSPENNPLVLIEPASFKNYNYSGELAYGWGLYLNTISQESKNGMTSISRQLQHYFRSLFNISKESYVETDISLKLVIRHIKNYLSQHPYVDKLIINLFNSGDAEVFADAFVELEKEKSFENINYEVRIFKGNDKIIEHGEALKTLINPEFNVSEEAEAFSQPSRNRLFPKLRFSINNILDFLKNPSNFTSHLSFLISPFPVTIELIKPYIQDRNFYLNGLITDSTVLVDEMDHKLNGIDL